MTLRRTAASFLLAALSFACAQAPPAGVVAVVNGHPITADDLDRYYRSQLQDQEHPPSDEQEQMLRLNLLREIIDRQILLQRAERLGLLAVDAEVDERYREFRAPYESEEEFRASLKPRGLTPEDLRAEIRRTISLEKLFNQLMSTPTRPADAELRQYYDQNKARFSVAEQGLHVARILVTPYAESPVPNLLNDDATDKKSAEEKIRMIEELLANGEDFATVAQKYSEDERYAASGGDMGYIPQSSLEKADLTLRRVVAALSPGDVSPVVESDGVFSIIKLIEREPAGQRHFEDPRVQQQIRSTLMGRREQLLKAALLESARSEAEVANYYARRILESYGVGD